MENNNEIVEKEKLKAVGQGKKMEPGVAKRFVEVFLGDSVENIGRNLASNAMTAVKDFIFTGINRGLEDMFYHNDPRGAYRAKKGGSGQFRKSANEVPYNKVYEEKNGKRTLTYEERARHDFQNVTFDTMPEATQALYEMRDRANVYGQSTVADLYSLAGFDSDYTDEKYGWRTDDLKFVNIKRHGSDGYFLDLIKPIDLSR